MESENQPMKIDRFLAFPRFQQIFHLIHFRFARNEEGRWVNDSELCFFTGFMLDFWFFGFNFFGMFLPSSDEISNQNLPVLSISVYFTIRGVLMFIKRHEIVDFVNVLDREFPTDLPTQRALQTAEVFKRYYKRHRFVNLYASIALPIFCSLPIFIYLLTYQDRNAPILLEHQLLGGWLPLNLRQNHLVYPLVWFYDVYAMLVGVTWFTSFDTLFNTIQTQVIMHIDGLRRQLEQLDAVDSVDSFDEGQFYEYIFSLIRRQQQINSICDRFNDLFKLALLVTDLVGATSICFHLYLITETQDPLMTVKYCCPMLALVIFTFDVCLSGTQLEEASSRLNEALYNQNWYMGSKKYRKLVCIWLKYTQCTRKLTAYGLAEVNMMHFTDIMQLAYKLFTFLKSRQ